MIIEKMNIKKFNERYGSFFKEPKKGKNKYNAIKTQIGDKTFDSKSEGNLFYELELQKKQGLIKDIECQAKEELWAYGVHIGNYYCDFKIIHNDGKIEFLEHKGIALPEWKLKWRMLLAKYDKEIADGKVVCNVNYHKGYFVKQKR